MHLTSAYDEMYEWNGVTQSKQATSVVRRSELAASTLNAIPAALAKSIVVSQRPWRCILEMFLPFFLKSRPFLRSFPNEHSWPA